MAEPGPTVAVGSIQAAGWIPGATEGGGANSRNRLAIARRGRPTRIAATIVGRHGGVARHHGGRGQRLLQRHERRRLDRQHQVAGAFGALRRQQAADAAAAVADQFAADCRGDLGQAEIRARLDHRSPTPGRGAGREMVKRRVITEIAAVRQAPRLDAVPAIGDPSPPLSGCCAMNSQRRDNLRRLLRPRHVAFVGGRGVAEAVRQCLAAGFSGAVWPVHPTLAEIAGLPCFREVDALPEPPDAAFIAVPSEPTIEVVRALARRGAGGCVCYAAGFAEIGEAALQRRLVEAAGDLALVGPNCYGLLNNVEGVVLWPSGHGGRRTQRGVALVAQSGNIALNLTLNQRSVPLSPRDQRRQPGSARHCRLRLGAGRGSRRRGHRALYRGAARHRRLRRRGR